MTNPNYVPLPGSTRSDAHGAEPIGPVDPTATVGFTVVLRRMSELPSELVYGPTTITPDELSAQYGASPADIECVVSTLKAAGAQVQEVHAGSRQIHASASVAVVQQLFGTELQAVRSEWPGAGAPVEHRARTGDLQLPAALDGVVVAVLGLDNRPQVRPCLQQAPAPQVAYSPMQFAHAYEFPQHADGTGQVAAILEFGGGFDTDDLNFFFQQYGIIAPTVTAVGVDGVVNTPPTQHLWSDVDVEVALDIEVLGALAPKANQLVYFGHWSDQGFLNVVNRAIFTSAVPTVMSISWGLWEEWWTPQARAAIDAAFADAAALGVTVCVASGDHDSVDQAGDGQQHVLFPASSPHVLAVGGTTLDLDPATGAVESETVWNHEGLGTGGGVSVGFPIPSWQAQVGIPTRVGSTTTGRGVPDVAADGDPSTGYQIRIGARDQSVGGTSAATPLWAALICRYAQILGTRFGLLHTAIYDGVVAGKPAAGFRDITVGDNGAYTAGSGWDACTGLGVPQGDALLAVLSNHIAR